jgi:16S rRNA (guanine527-N7)-methyltransferase
MENKLKNFNLTEMQLNKLLLYMEMVISENKLYNLTSIVEYDEFIEKHIIDSLLILEHVK